MIALGPWILPPAVIAGAVLLNETPSPLPWVRRLPTPWQLASFDLMPDAERLWPPARVETNQRFALSLTGNSYHPMVATLARPNCLARAVRLPVAVALQGAVDLLVGTCLLGTCIGLCILGFGQEADHIADNRNGIVFASLAFYMIPLTVLTGWYGAQAWTAYIDYQFNI